MENNDFDIFEFVKLLFKQKAKVLLFTVLFAAVFFLVQFMLPAKYSVKFMASSTVLKQNEVVLKLEQLQNLVVNNADSRLAELLDIPLKQAESIAFIDIVPVKNTNDLVQVEMKTSEEQFAATFIERIHFFMESDPLLKEMEQLKMEQLNYGLGKLNEELDSLKTFQTGGVIILNGNPNMVDLLDKKTRIENDLLLFDLFYVYEGYEVIKHETGVLMMTLSSLLAGFALSLISVLGLHFVQLLNSKS